MTFADTIDRLGASTAPPAAPSQPLPPFDEAVLRRTGVVKRLIQRLVDRPQPLLGFLRRWWPIARLPFTDWAVVTRFDDVQEVLFADAHFPTPFGWKVEALNGGPNFLLGMENGPDYRAVRAVVRSVFDLDAAQTAVARISAEEARAIVADARGRLDGIADLIATVPMRVVERHYGVAIPDERAFWQWSIAMSTFMFGDPGDDPALRDVALAAGAHMRRVVDAAVGRAARGEVDSATVAARLARYRDAAGVPLPPDQQRAILIGMITGFVPTNTMAAGHMLAMLLARPDMLHAAREAALADDDKRLSACLHEAMRFKPLNPGPFRVCSQDHVVAAGTRRATRIRAGTKLLVSTQSAMLDPRRVARPEAFDPDRPASTYMLYGTGLHWCIGAPLADAQITQTFKPLLRRANLRAAPGEAGTLRRFGPFPEHLEVTFEP